MKSNLNRRSFGKLAASSALLWGLPSRSLKAADATKDPFILYIHCGAWDGISGGLLQPRDAGDWQRGLFVKNTSDKSVNPNLNAHSKYGNLVFTDYHLPLAAIANHTCFTVGNPQSLSHEVARMIQHTGDGSGTNNPAWAIGLAHALGSSTSQNIVISDSTPGATKGKANSSEITRSRSLAEFSASVSDPTAIPNADSVNAEKFWDILNGRNVDALKDSPEMAQAIRFHIDTMTKGFSATRDTELLNRIDNAISVAKYEAHLSGVADAAAVKTINTDVNRTTLLNQFRLAAFLAESGLARGMTITTNLGDRHAGGASVDTARSSSMVFAQLAAFWQYIVAQKMQDRVMVIVSHEFSRTTYNNSPGPTATVKARNAQGNLVDVSVRSPGCDHHLAFGMIFINSKVPSKARVGGISDLYVPFGSKDLRGVADLDTPAYKSTDLVGSMMMRCFGNIFNDERAVRQIWQGFSPIDLIVG